MHDWFFLIKKNAYPSDPLAATGNYQGKLCPLK